MRLLIFAGILAAGSAIAAASPTLAAPAIPSIAADTAKLELSATAKRRNIDRGSRRARTRLPHCACHCCPRGAKRGLRNDRCGRHNEGPLLPPNLGVGMGFGL
jgi:hypothetical protein